MACFCYKTFMRLEYLFFLLGYFVLLLLVSFVFSKRMKNLEDFFLASRKLPGSLIFLSIAASWLGATSILVSVDEAYRLGISAFWVIGVPAVLTASVFAVFLVRPIKRLPIVSLPDLVEMRYGRIVRHLASLLIVWYMILLASSQMVAIGKFLKILLGTPYIFSLLLGTGVVLVYSACGGFFSVVITDSLQFFLFVIGIISLFFFLLGSSSLQEISLLAEQIGKSGYFNFFFAFKRNFLIALSFTLAWIISPIVWQRIQAARTEKDGRYGLLTAAGTFLLLYGVIVLVGIFSLPLFSGENYEGSLLSVLILSKTGTLLGGIMCIAIVAAIMSTMDTAINTGALSLTRDVYQQIPFFKRDGNILTVSRVATLIVGVIALIIAVKLQSILRTLGLASEIMAEGLFIPGVAMLFLRRKLPTAGFLSLILGGGYSLIGFFVEMRFFQLDLPPWPFSVPYGVAASLIGFILGLLIDLTTGSRADKAGS